MQSSGRSVLTESFLCLQIRPCLCPITYLCMLFWFPVQSHDFKQKKLQLKKRNIWQHCKCKRISVFDLSSMLRIILLFSKYIILRPGVHFFFHWVLSMYLHRTAEYKRPHISVLCECFGYQYLILLPCRSASVVEWQQGIFALVTRLWCPFSRCSANILVNSTAMLALLWLQSCPSAEWALSTQLHASLLCMDRRQQPQSGGTQADKHYVRATASQLGKHSFLSHLI